MTFQLTEMKYDFIFNVKILIMKLSAFLKDKKQTSFEVANVTFEMTEARDGQPAQKVAILHLAKPISLVQSSQTFTDEATGESVRNEAYDVDTVRIVERDFDTDGIDIDESGKGTVNVDLRLDVSRRGDVWLTGVSFSAYGRNARRQRLQERNTGVVRTMQERKAMSTLKDANVPNPSAAAKPDVVQKAKVS